MTTPQENNHPGSDQISIHIDRIKHEIDTILTSLTHIANLLGIPKTRSTDD